MIETLIQESLDNTTEQIRGKVHRMSKEAASKLSREKACETVGHCWQNKPHLIYCKQPDHIYYEDRCKRCGKLYTKNLLLEVNDA